MSFNICKLNTHHDIIVHITIPYLNLSNVLFIILFNLFMLYYVYFINCLCLGISNLMAEPRPNKYVYCYYY